MQNAALVSVLARSLLAGEQSIDQAHDRAIRTLRHAWRWLRPLIARYLLTFEGRTRPRQRDVVRFLLGDAEFQQTRAKYGRKIRIAEWVAEPARMQPVSAASEWHVPLIETIADLADWLSLYPAELEWFADLKALGNKLGNSKLQHYVYRLERKRAGGFRVIESPKSDLKAVQRRILSGILDRIPVHRAVHGFVRGRSIVTYAAPHVGQAALLRIDLKDFFPAFPAARVEALFRTLGYPEPVADRLAGLCTNAMARRAWGDRPADVDANEWYDARLTYATRHLPQGAATSPALANLMAYRLDCRLTGLARSTEAVYTRYADDLAFSGGPEFARAARRFSMHAAAIALEEGFSVNHRKTRIMRPGTQQRLAGVVVNETLSLPRRELERLEAILTNCARSGPASQNRERVPDFHAHLQGRVAFAEMVNREKGRQLRAVFDAIRW